MSGESMNPETLALSIVRTWIGVVCHKFKSKPDAFTEDIQREMLHDALALMRLFGTDNPGDFGAAIRNACDEVNGRDEKFKHLTRLDIEEQMQVIRVKRLKDERSVLLLSRQGKAEPIERISGAHFLDFDFPEIWRQSRDNELGIFPNIWDWDGAYPEDKKAMPIILERLKALFADERFSHHRDNAAAMAYNICNRLYQIEVAVAKVPDLLAKAKFYPRREKWTPKVCAEIDGMITAYNANKKNKIRFSASETAHTAACQAACYYYGLLTIQENGKV